MLDLSSYILIVDVTDSHLQSMVSYICPVQDYVGLALDYGDDEIPDLMQCVCHFLQELVQGPCLQNQQVLAGERLSL